MEPKKVGRALGVGVRVASKMVQKRMADASAGQSAQHRAPVATSGAPAGFARATGTRPASSAAGKGNRAATARRGFKAFGQAFLGPFTHAGSILWLEITGMFFALFMLFFAQSVYRVRGSWRGGPDHIHFLLYVVLTAGFAWFSGSSFLRAYRKSQRGR